VLCIVTISTLDAEQPGDGTARLAARDAVEIDRTATAAALAAEPTTAPTATPRPTEAPIAAPTARPPTNTPVVEPTVAPTEVASPAVKLAGLLPTYRVLAFYGHPRSKAMGILGEYDIETLYAKMKEQAAVYEAADPTRPVMLAFEVIASVAQPEPGADGTYLLYTGATAIDEYADFAAAHNMQLILDVQIGRATVADEIEAVRPWLLRPNVHLALDPEFAVPEGSAPGDVIGGIDAADVAYAQETLAQISAENNLPPKMLIVHQFVEWMIVDKAELVPVPGVQLVIEVDGFGVPVDKAAIYAQFVENEPIEFGGIKLFNRKDEPLMTPREVLALTPSPDLVIYH
jgi:hypothetical protein